MQFEVTIITPNIIMNTATLVHFPSYNILEFVAAQSIDSKNLKSLERRILEGKWNWTGAAKTIISLLELPKGQKSINIWTNLKANQYGLNWVSKPLWWWNFCVLQVNLNLSYIPSTSLGLFMLWFTFPS